jgi:hypothetical protein
LPPRHAIDEDVQYQSGHGQKDGRDHRGNRAQPIDFAAKEVRGNNLPN